MVIKKVKTIHRKNKRSKIRNGGNLLKAPVTEMVR